jgi:hypothetical protein
MSDDQFPADENGNVLRSLLRSGDNFSIPRDIDFQVIFPNEAAAEAVGQIVGNWGYTAEVRFPGPHAELPWEVNVKCHMLPTHEGITKFEAELEAMSAPLGGRNDGGGVSPSRRIE